VTEDQPLLSRRRPAILAGGDLAIGAADTERDAVDEQLAVPRFRLIDLDDGGRPRFQGTAVSARIAPVSLFVPEVWERINQGLAKALPGFS
jgi:hypothetical protein